MVALHLNKNPRRNLLLAVADNYHNYRSAAREFLRPSSRRVNESFWWPPFSWSCPNEIKTRRPNDNNQTKSS